jgi:cytochrome c553
MAYGAFAAAQGSPAATPAPGPNDACLMCHGSAEAKAASGKSVAVDAAKFAGSVHGSMQLPCTACHADVSADKFPHGEVKPVACANCHDKAVKEYASTIHGKARAGGNHVAATCANCHGTHDILKSSDPGSRTNHANLERTCGACHGNEAMIQQAKLPGGNVAGLYHDSIHGQAMAKKASTKDAVPTCTNCHGAHDMRPRSDPLSRVARANVPDTCGGCHMNVKAIWQKSEHGKLRQAHVLQAPGCTDCHSTHGIRSHQDPQFKLAVTEQCGTCHEEFIRTYRDTFHGQVTQLGFSEIATCASCHGAHEVLPKDNPLSKVSAQNRLATCQGCHPKANANFVSYDPHANKHNRARGQLLFFASKFMDLLLLGVFAFFGAHTLLWFFRSLKAVRERRSGGREEKH